MKDHLKALMYFVSGLIALALFICLSITYGLQLLGIMFGGFILYSMYIVYRSILGSIKGR